MMRKPMNEGTRRFDALGNDVTETGDYAIAKAAVEAHEAMLSELGLDAEATQAEIDAAKAKKGAEIEYEQAKEVIAEYEARVAETGAEPEPDPITPEDTQEYEEAKAIVAAYDAAAAAPQPEVAEKPVEKSTWR